MAFCNRFALLEIDVDEMKELVEGEVSEPSAAKEARWRKWRPRKRARACHRKQGPSATESLDWDALSIDPPGAPPSLCPILALRILTYVCVCGGQRACSSGSPLAPVTSAPTPPLSKPTQWWCALLPHQRPPRYPIFTDLPCPFSHSSSPHWSRGVHRLCWA